MLYLRCRCGSLQIRTLFPLHKPKLYSHESLHFPSKVCPSSSKAQPRSVCSKKIISARSVLLFIIVMLLSVPVTLTQAAAIDELYIQPTSALHTVKKVNSANNGRSDYIGYHHNVRPEVGLLTSTARTFIQEGVTTEYGTQVVGTTLDSGRLYAQFLRKSSRVLYNNGHKQQQTQQAVVSPTVVTSWVGDNLQLQSKSLLESHNDLFNADLPDWQDIDDRLLRDEGNIFVGNTDFAHLSEARNKKQQEPLTNDEKKKSSLIIATLLSQNLTDVARNNTPKHLFSLHTVGNTGNQNQDFGRILDVNKVMPIGDLATYTVRNPFSVSGFPEETIIEHSELTQSNAVNNYRNNDNKLSRSPKQCYQKQMDPNGSDSSLKNALKPLFNSQLPTITYYGFADFTTVVGESVIVFSPSSVTQNINLGRVTSIKGEATLKGVSDIEQDTTIGAIKVAMEFEVEPTQQISSLPNLQLMNLNSKMIQSLNFVDVSSEISREEAEGILHTLTTDVNDKELSLKQIKLVTTSNENIKISYFTDKLSSVSDNTFKTIENMLGSTTAYSRPLDNEDAEIYASLSRIAASRESISSTMQTVVPSYIINNSLLLKLSENTNEQPITNTVELVSKSVEALQSSELTHHTTTAILDITPTNTSSELQILGGATTIFYEDDPFANFVEPVFSATKATDILNLTDIKITTQPEYGTSTLSNIPITTEEYEDSVETTTIVTKILTNITSDEYEVQKSSSSSSSIDTSQSVSNVSEVSQNDTKRDVQEMNTDDDVVELRDCIRTSQTFLTQIAKTITQLNTLRESALPGEDEAIQYSTIETVLLPTFDILETTKFYCIKPQTATVGATSFAIGDIKERVNDGVKLEKNGLDNIYTATLAENMDDVGDGLADDDINYITTISANINERDLLEYTTTDPVDSDNNNETDVNNESDSDINFDQSIYALEDDSGEDIELIYKTLYTTYTYLTTYFNDDSSTSISSHTEVFTNIITSTLESDIDEIKPISSTKEILNTENALKLSIRDSSNNGNKVSSSSKFVLPTELETILRVGDHDIDIDKTGDATDAHTATMFLDDSKIVKTYFTTYTYYTTIFVEGETEIMSRTEVYTNYVTDAVTSTTVFEIDKQSRIDNDNIASNVEMLSNLNQDTGANNIDIDTKRQRDENTQNMLNDYQRLSDNTIRAHAAILFHDDHLSFSNYTLVTDIRSSSSNGKKHIINQNQEAFFDQISSESNTDEIRPSAILLLQTSFTTFTYYTTMYSNNATNVISRLETATDVVTETLQPTKTSSVDEVTLPITYFTTFTYWTKLAKNGEITTLSREETVSNIVTPNTISSTPIQTANVLLSNGNTVQGKQPKTQISNTDQLDKTTTVHSTNTIHNSVGNSSIDNENTGAVFEPTTYYTTYTYYTTSYNGDGTTTDSRFETITHVVSPTNIADKTIEGAAGERNIVSSANLVTDILALAINNAVTPTLQKSPNTLLYDYKRIIDADGVSTLYYRTEILATTAIDGMQSNFTSSSSSLHVDELKQALLPSNIIANSDISSVRQYKTGLVRLIEGTRIGNHTTTLYQSKVIGTFIENRYAQIIESTSSFLFETNNNNMITTDGSIKPSLTLPSTDQIEATVNVVALTLQNSIVENASNSTATTEYSKEDEENFDVDAGNEDDGGDGADGKINKDRLSYQSKKRTFTPVIRPFTSRNRPQFAPKKKNGVTSSATIITRHDFTPTITATPALKSSGRFSTRKGVFTGIITTTGASAAIPNSSSSRRTFGRPIKSLSSTGSISTSNTPAILSASGFSGGRNRLPSSTRLQSSTRRAGVLVRPTSASGNRQGFSSTSASNTRVRIKSTSLTQTGLQNTPSTEGLPILTSETSGEESTTPEFQASFDENDEGSIDVARRSQNPLIRLRRPLNRPTGFISSSQRVVNGGSSISSIGSVSQRRNPLTLRAKPTTLTSTTTTTQTPRARSLERPKINNALSRTRPQNSLFPPRGLLQRQTNQEINEAKENKKADSTEGNVDIDDDSEYDDEDEEDNEDDAEGDNNRRRRSNIKQHKLSTGVENTSTTDNYKIKYLSTRSKSIRVRREAETPLQRRSSFRNRFRRPKLTASATTAEDQNYKEDIEKETPPFLTTAVTRSRTSGRFAPRYGLQHASTQAVTAPATTTSTGNHHAIRPTRPSNGRAQFTLREKDTTTTTQKGLTRPGTSHFRRPQTAASSRRSSSPTISNRRKTFNNNSNLSQDAVMRSTPSRARTNLSRTRTTVRGRSRNDYNVDTLVLPYDGTITITHVIPAEVTIPVVNGKITEYKNVVTAKTSTEILSPQQYTTFLGSNGQTMLALTREDSSVNFGGVTEVTQYVLHESPTTTIIFTPTTIRGRKTSFSHVIPSTVYSVENVISTTQPQISPNAPLANILLSQLLLGNIGLPPANPLLGALGAAATPPPIQLGVGSLVPPTPVTEYRTHTSTYVTTVFEGMSTVLPVTFQGKKILTTVYDTTAQTITATEFVTDTIVTTPIHQTHSAPQVNSLLIQQLLLQQQLQPQLPILHSTAPHLLLSDNLQELDTNHIRLSKENDNDIAVNEDYTQHNKTSRKKSRKSSKGHKRKHQSFQDEVPERSSIITLYVSGRRPGEFSTILSTVPLGSDSTIHKRQAPGVLQQTSKIYTIDNFYTSDGSEYASTYLMPQLKDDKTKKQIELNLLESGGHHLMDQQTQSLESIVGDVDTWIAQSTHSFENAVALEKQLAPTMPLQRRDAQITEITAENGYRRQGNGINASIQRQTRQHSGHSTRTSSMDRSLNTVVVSYAPEFNDDSASLSELDEEKEIGEFLEGARFNLATRVMWNGIELIIANDKSKPSSVKMVSKDLSQQQEKQHVPQQLYSELSQSSFRPMTLTPSTLKNKIILAMPTQSANQENFYLPADFNQFVTKTCLTTYTYRTTYLQNGSTTVESREQVISNIATEQRNYMEITPPLPLVLTLTQTASLAIGIFPTTYFYYNTINDNGHSVVQLSKHTIVNTITGPDGYINFLQPSEEATPIYETNTYYSKLKFTNILQTNDAEEMFVTTNILTQVIVTESLAPCNSLLLKYIGPNSAHIKSESNGILTYKKPEPIKHSKTVLYEKKSKYNIHIYTTKTFVTTLTYLKTTSVKTSDNENYSTMHRISPFKKLATSEMVERIQSAQNELHSTVSYRTRIIENVITETVPSSLFHNELVSKFRDVLQTTKPERHIFITTASLLNGETLEITAMRIFKPSLATAKEKLKNGLTPEETTVLMSTSVPLQNIHTLSDVLSKRTKLNTTLKISTTDTKIQNTSTGLFNAVHAVFDEDTLSADTEYNEYHSSISPQFLKPSKPQQNQTKLHLVDNIIITTTTKNKTRLPVAVSQIIDSLNLQRLNALRPVINAMAGLLQGSFTTASNQLQLIGSSSVPSPLSTGTEIASVSSSTHLSSTKRYDYQEINGGAVIKQKKPLYIPVIDYEIVSHKKKLSNNAAVSAEGDPLAMYNAQRLHLQSNADIKYLQKQTLSHHANSRKKSESLNMLTQTNNFKILLINSGIAIRPGEVIRANSDVIIGKPNGIQHPQSLLASNLAKLEEQSQNLNVKHFDKMYKQHVQAFGKPFMSNNISAIPLKPESQTQNWNSQRKPIMKHKDNLSSKLTTQQIIRNYYANNSLPAENYQNYDYLLTPPPPAVLSNIEKLEPMPSSHITNFSVLKSLLPTRLLSSVNDLHKSKKRYYAINYNIASTHTGAQIYDRNLASNNNNKLIKMHDLIINTAKKLPEVFTFQQQSQQIENQENETSLSKYSPYSYSALNASDNVVVLTPQPSKSPEVHVGTQANHQNINLHTHVFSHNVNMHALPLTFKKETDYPKYATAIHGQIPKVAESAVRYTMSLIKIPHNEKQVQVNLTPQNIIEQIGNPDEYTKTDSSVIDSFSLYNSLPSDLTNLQQQESKAQQPLQTPFNPNYAHLYIMANNNNNIDIHNQSSGNGEDVKNEYQGMFLPAAAGLTTSDTLTQQRYPQHAGYKVNMYNTNANANKKSTNVIKNVTSVNHATTGSLNTASLYYQSNNTIDEISFLKSGNTYDTADDGLLVKNSKTKAFISHKNRDNSKSKPKNSHYVILDEENIELNVDQHTASATNSLYNKMRTEQQKVLQPFFSPVAAMKVCNTHTTIMEQLNGDVTRNSGRNSTVPSSRKNTHPISYYATKVTQEDVEISTKSPVTSQMSLNKNKCTHNTQLWSRGTHFDVERSEILQNATQKQQKKEPTHNETLTFNQHQEKICDLPSPITASSTLSLFRKQQQPEPLPSVKLQTPVEHPSNTQDYKTVNLKAILQTLLQSTPLEAAQIPLPSHTKNRYLGRTTAFTINRNIPKEIPVSKINGTLTNSVVRGDINLISSTKVFLGISTNALSAINYNDNKHIKPTATMRDTSSISLLWNSSTVYTAFQIPGKHVNNFTADSKYTTELYTNNKRKNTMYVQQSREYELQPKTDVSIISNHYVLVTIKPFLESSEAVTISPSSGGSLTDAFTHLKALPNRLLGAIVDKSNLTNDETKSQWHLKYNSRTIISSDTIFYRNIELLPTKYITRAHLITSPSTDSRIFKTTAYDQLQNVSFFETKLQTIDNTITLSEYPFGNVTVKESESSTEKAKETTAKILETYTNIFAEATRVTLGSVLPIAEFVINKEEKPDKSFNLANDIITTEIVENDNANPHFNVGNYILPQYEQDPFTHAILSHKPQNNNIKHNNSFEIYEDNSNKIKMGTKNEVQILNISNITAESVYDPKNSIFIVMTNSQSNIKAKQPHGLSNVIKPDSADASSTVSGAAGDFDNIDTNTGTFQLDYDDSVSVFNLPARDEESIVEPHDFRTKINEVSLGGVFIASPSKKNDFTVINPMENSTCMPPCKMTSNEVCTLAELRWLCVCRPGFARMFPDRPCKPTYTYQLSLHIDHFGDFKLVYDHVLADNSTNEYKHLATVTKEAINRMVMQSDLRDIYHGVQLSTFTSIYDGNMGTGGKTANTESSDLSANLLLQLSENSNEVRLMAVFKKYLRFTNYSIGGTKLFTDRNGVESLAITDFNECAHGNFHDCSSHALCFNLQGTYTCSCKENFADLSGNRIYPGRICSAELVGCDRCHYHGKCAIKKFNHLYTSEHVVCECFAWYTGSTCQLNLKIVLVVLIAVGTLLFTLLIFCILLMCTKRHTLRKKYPAASQYNRGIHRITGLPDISLINGKSTHGIRGCRSKRIKIDKCAIIKDTSSESSKNTLLYVLKKDPTDISKKSYRRSRDPHIKADSSSVNVERQRYSPYGHVAKPETVNVNATYNEEDTLNKHNCFTDSTYKSTRHADQPLTVMIPRAKYHSSVLAQTGLLHQHLIMEHTKKQDEQRRVQQKRYNKSDGTTLMTLRRDNNRNNMQKHKKVLSKLNIRGSEHVEVMPGRNIVDGDCELKNMHLHQLGALVSAGFEVSALVGENILITSSTAKNKHITLALNNSGIIDEFDSNYLRSNLNRGYDIAKNNDSNDSNIDNSKRIIRLNQATLVPSEQQKQYQQQMAKLCSYRSSSENRSSGKDENNFLDSMDVWFGHYQRNMLSTEALSSEESTAQTTMKPLHIRFDVLTSNTNDDTNSMAEREVGSTFLLPHTHLYEPDKQESDISGFDI